MYFSLILIESLDYLVAKFMLIIGYVIGNCQR